MGSPVSGATGKSYTPSLAELPSTAGVYYYAVVATNGSCTATAYQKLTVNPTPELTVSDSKTICQGGSVDISATSAGNTINWYLLSSGGSPVHTSASAEIYTVSPSSNTTYYAEAVSAQTCISVRKPVVITVNPIPGTPVLAHSSINNQCPALTANLTAQIPGSPSTAGGVYEWHVSNSSTSALVSNPAAVTSGAYYLFEKSAAGCYSAPAIITVGIVPCDCSVPATVDIAPLAKVCAGSGPVQLAGTIGGSATSAKWTTSGTGTFDNVNSLTAKYTPSQADISAGSVILTLTTNKPSEELCPAAFKNIILTISPKPLPPVGIKCDPEICLGGANKLFAVSQGNTVKWYTTPTGGSSIGEATLDGFVVTPTEAKTYTYYAEAVTPDGCISDRTPLSFVVKKCYTDLAVTKSVINKKASYALGETLTYLIVAENLGPNDAKNVIVKDILPAGALAYVSSSPAGYDNTTGIWTIGDLNNTSSKTLAITVKTLKTGTIANTAEISSPDEDPDPSKHLNNTSTVTIVVEDLADLSLTKVVSNVSPNVGENITYTITVSNAGPSTATNIKVRDILPAGIDFVSSGDFTNSAGTLTASIASLAKNGSVALKFIAKVTASGKIVNMAEISQADQKDPDSTPGNANTTHEDDDDKVEINTSTVCNLPTPILACLRPEICLGDSISISATGCDGYTTTWNTGAHGASIWVKPAVNTTYTAYCESGICKSPVSYPINVKVITVSGPLLSASPSMVCAGSQSVLTATSCGGVLTWNTGEHIPQITVSPSVTTTYTATCAEYGCVSPAGNVTVVVSPKPAAPRLLCTCKTINICPGESITLTALNCDGQIKWSDGQTTTSITVTPTSDINYTATCTVNGCTSDPSAPNSIVVTPVAPPTVSVNNSTICAGGSAILKADGCTGLVTWNTGATGASIIVSPGTTTTYTATCSTISCKSAASAPVVVNVGSIVAPIISYSASSICPGGSAQLTSVGCTGNVVWSDGQTGSSITVSPSVTTVYSAKCVNGTCESGISNQVSISVGNFAAPSIIASTNTICNGGTVTLTASGCNGTVKWSVDNLTGSSITVTPTTTTTYSAICTSATCTSGKSNEVTVTVSSPGNPPTITASKTTICPQESVTLTASGCDGGTIKWSPGNQIAASITVNPSITTTYTAKCIKNGCESAPSEGKTITVTVPVDVQLATFSDKNNVCPGTSVTLTASGCESTVTWSPGNLTGSSVSVSPTATTTYTATCAASACTAQSSATITITVLPNGGTVQVLASADKNNVCPGTSVTLTASGCGSTVTWSPGNLTGSSVSVSPTTTTTYTATCAASGCSAQTTSSVTVTVLPNGGTAQVVASADKNNVCPGTSVTLTASGCGSTVTWSPGNLTGSSVSVSPTTTTTYTATCAASGCSAQTTSSVTVTVLPNGGTAQVLASSDKNNVCPGTAVTLTASGCGSTVTWSPGNLTGSSVSVSPTTTTTYTATCAASGCSAQTTSSVTVTVLPNGGTAQVVASADKNNVCPGTSVTLTASGCGSTVTWSPGNLTGSSVSVSPTATTTYTATCAASGCSAQTTSSVTVTVLPNGGTAQVVASVDKNNVCPGTSVTLTASGCGSTVTWSPGNLTGSSVSVSPTTTTTYTATCAASGCSAQTTSSVTITVLPNGGTAQVVASADKNNVCPGTSVTLTASGCGSTVTWSPGNLTGSSVSVSPTTTTTYTATCAASGCSAQSSSAITVIVLPNATKPTIATNVQGPVCAGTEVTLTAGNCNGTLLWNTGETASSIKVKPTAITSYTVKCSVNGCESSVVSDVTTITIGNPVTPSVTASSTLICTGGQVTLTASGCTNGTILWSNGKTGSTITETLGSTGTFSAVCKIADCSSPESAKVTVNVNIPGIPIISCFASTICKGESLTLTASGCAGVVKWSNNQEGTTITVSPTETTDYYATCKIGTCESAHSSVATVNVGLPAAPQVKCSNTLICAGTEVTLSATGCSGTTKWNTGDIGATILVAPNVTTTYYAVCKTENCESPISNKVTVTVGDGLKLLLQPTLLMFALSKRLIWLRQ
ncbi:hypothetical protein ACFFJX_00010 [Pseudarcicella hirudinis]|uniref:Ig-like domain-containing protein n=1 Tax=Pseudarcicella hirudinis TaxID=1079859 RepID=UPI0035E4E0DE